jgi:hypothetical protein
VTGPDCRSGFGWFTQRVQRSQPNVGGCDRWLGGKLNPGGWRSGVTLHQWVSNLTGSCAQEPPGKCPASSFTNAGSALSGGLRRSGIWGSPDQRRVYLHQTER